MWHILKLLTKKERKYKEKKGKKHTFKEHPFIYLHWKKEFGNN